MVRLPHLQATCHMVPALLIFCCLDVQLVLFCLQCFTRDVLLCLYQVLSINDAHHLQEEVCLCKDTCPYCRVILVCCWQQRAADRQHRHHSAVFPSRLWLGQPDQRGCQRHQRCPGFLQQLWRVCTPLICPDCVVPDQNCIELTQLATVPVFVVLWLFCCVCSDGQS